jgi:hypothetical protein
MPALDACPEAVDRALRSDEAAQHRVLAQHDREGVERERIFACDDELIRDRGESANAPVAAPIEQQFASGEPAESAVEDRVQVRVLERPRGDERERVAAVVARDRFEQGAN